MLDRLFRRTKAEHGHSNGRMMTRLPQPNCPYPVITVCPTHNPVVYSWTGCDGACKYSGVDSLSKESRSFLDKEPTFQKNINHCFWVVRSDIVFGVWQPEGILNLFSGALVPMQDIREKTQYSVDCFILANHFTLLQNCLRTNGKSPPKDECPKARKTSSLLYSVSNRISVFNLFDDESC